MSTRFYSHIMYSHFASLDTMRKSIHCRLSLLHTCNARSHFNRCISSFFRQSEITFCLSLSLAHSVSQRVRFAIVYAVRTCFQFQDIVLDLGFGCLACKIFFPLTPFQTALTYMLASCRLLFAPFKYLPLYLLYVLHRRTNHFNTHTVPLSLFASTKFTSLAVLFFCCSSSSCCSFTFWHFSGTLLWNFSDLLQLLLHTVTNSMVASRSTQQRTAFERTFDPFECNFSSDAKTRAMKTTSNAFCIEWCSKG